MKVQETADSIFGLTEKRTAAHGREDLELQASA